MYAYERQMYPSIYLWNLLYWHASSGRTALVAYLGHLRLLNYLRDIFQLIASNKTYGYVCH